MFAKVTQEQNRYEEAIRRMQRERLEVHVANQSIKEAQDRYKAAIKTDGGADKIKDIIGKCIDIDGKPAFEIIHDADTRDASPAQSPD